MLKPLSLVCAEQCLQLSNVEIFPCHGAFVSVNEHCVDGGFLALVISTVPVDKSVDKIWKEVLNDQGINSLG